MICLDTEFAFLNMQTSSYSLEVVVWTAVYVLVVLGLPMFVVKVCSRRVHLGSARALSTA